MCCCSSWQSYCSVSVRLLLRAPPPPPPPLRSLRDAPLSLSWPFSSLCLPLYVPDSPDLPLSLCLFAPFFVVPSVTTVPLLVSDSPRWPCSTTHSFSFSIFSVLSLSPFFLLRLSLACTARRLAVTRAGVVVVSTPYLYSVFAAPLPFCFALSFVRNRCRLWYIPYL